MGMCKNQVPVCSFCLKYSTGLTLLDIFIVAKIIMLFHCFEDWKTQLPCFLHISRVFQLNLLLAFYHMQSKCTCLALSSSNLSYITYCFAEHDTMFPLSCLNIVAIGSVVVSNNEIIFRKVHDYSRKISNQLWRRAGKERILGYQPTGIRSFLRTCWVVYHYLPVLVSKPINACQNIKYWEEKC